MGIFMHIKGTPSKDTSWPENTEKVQFFPSCRLCMVILLLFMQLEYLLRLKVPQSTAMLVSPFLVSSGKDLFMMLQTLLLHMLTLFMISHTQNARHKVPALTAMFSWLSWFLSRHKLTKKTDVSFCYFIPIDRAHNSFSFGVPLSRISKCSPRLQHIFYSDLFFHNRRAKISKSKR